jgi:hypothetical protein
MRYQITCERCGKAVVKYRRDGKPPRFCTRECSWAATREAKVRVSGEYWAVHARVRRARGPAKAHDCARCPARAHDWAQLHGKDGFDPADYIPLCRSCHLLYDRTDETRAKLAVAATHRTRDLSGRFC